jgi:pyruvate formate lyase activating enzyme
VGREVTVAELLTEIERDVVFYDQSGGGVTLSGGEPLVQAEFVGELLRACKAGEIHSAVDTTCHAPWAVIEAISDHVDLFLCDLKHMDPAAHQHFSGVSNELILENIERLARRGKEIVIRIPIIPGLNDDDENVLRSAEFAASLDAVRRIDILPYNRAAQGKLARLGRAGEQLEIERPSDKRAESDAPNEKRLELEAPSDERLRAIARRLEAFGFAVKTGG